MLKVFLGSNYEELATHLAANLKVPFSKGSALEKIMTPEWVVSPSAGTYVWLKREIARQTGGDEATDGIVANWHHEFPMVLMNRLWQAERSSRQKNDDPWQITPMTMKLMEWASQPEVPKEIKSALSGGGSIPKYARARHFADLFDRYHVWRHDLIRGWLQGETLLNDADSLAIAQERIQMAMWQGLRSFIDEPSLPESFSRVISPENMDRVFSSNLAPNAERVHIFGPTAFPGGENFIKVLEAYATKIDVYLYLVHGFENERVGSIRDRNCFDTVALQLWGGLAAANLPLIQALRSLSEAIPQSLSSEHDYANNLLGSLQYALRNDSLRTKPIDASNSPGLIEHWCHGAMRQVEVLRDAIVHDLELHPDLDESDILVVCPDIETFAPLIKVAFGASRYDRSGTADDALAYRLVDAQLGEKTHFQRGVTSLFALLPKRFERMDVITVLREPAIRRALRLSSEDLESVEAWIDESNIRWGLSSQHRNRFGVSNIPSAGSWEMGLKRLALGAMVENPLLRATGNTLPVEVPASRIDLLSRLSRFLRKCEQLTEAVDDSRTLSEWAQWTLSFLDDMVQPQLDEREVAARFHATLIELTQLPPTTAHMSYFDFVGHINETWQSRGGRGLLSGGITITSPDTLRWIPFRSIYILGFDGDAFSHAGWDPDDLRRVQPRSGEVSRDDDLRAQLSELILCATDRLTTIRNGRRLADNAEEQAGVAFAEYRDIVTDVARASNLPATFVDDVVTHHRRQSFNPTNFVSEADEFEHLKKWGVIEETWGTRETDLVLALRGGRSAVERKHEIPVYSSPAPLANGAASFLSLHDLSSFLNDPVATFARRQLGISRSDWEGDESGLLEVGLSPLRMAALRRKVVANGVIDSDRLDALYRAMVNSGYLPPEHVGVKKSDILLFENMAQVAAEAKADRDPVVVKVDIEAGPWRLVDTVEASQGDDGLRILVVVPEVMRPYRYIQPWLQAVAVAATSDDNLNIELQMIVMKEAAGSKKQGQVITQQLPFIGNAATARSVLKNVLSWYESNLMSPIPFSKYIHKIGSDLIPTQEMWGPGSKNVKGLLKPDLWRIAFGDIPLEVMTSDTGPLSLVKFGSTLGAAMTSTFSGFDFGSGSGATAAKDGD